MTAKKPGSVRGTPEQTRPDPSPDTAPLGIRMSDADSDRFEELLLRLHEMVGLTALIDSRLEAFGRSVPEELVVGTGMLRRGLERVHEGLEDLWRPGP